MARAVLTFASERPLGEDRAPFAHTGWLVEATMDTNDLWQEGQYDALAKISPELRARLAEWAPKAKPREKAARGVARVHAELAQLVVVHETCCPRLA